MLFSHHAYIGINQGSGRVPFTFAALDAECNLTALAHGGLEDVLTFVSSFPSAIAAVNTPSNLIRVGTRQRPDQPAPVAERGLVIRQAALKPDSARAKLGRALYEGLRQAGFVLHPDEDATHLWLETNPQACFTVLLGKKLLSRATLEGRLQRHIILYDADLGVKDPMDFFEELTRHRLRMGILPEEQLYTASQLDSLVMAYTAWMAIKRPAETNRVGSNEDGFIVLPVGELKEKY